MTTTATTTTLVQQTDDSFSVVLPAKAIEGLELQNGDRLEVIATANGVELRRVQSELERQMAIAERVMAEDEVALRKLAE